MRTISQRPADLARPVARAMALTLGVLAGAGIWAWWSQYEQRALLSLPVAERVRIYDRNLESMRVLCGDSKLTGAFESRCREQALFLAEFPECDSACRTLVEPHLRPSR